MFETMQSYVKNLKDLEGRFFDTRRLSLPQNLSLEYLNKKRSKYIWLIFDHTMLLL